MVVGARTGGNGRTSRSCAGRRSGCSRGSRATSAARPIPDLNSGLRVFRRRHFAQFLRIIPNGFSFTTTITLAFLCNGLSVDYVPIDYRRRVGEVEDPAATTLYDFMILILRVIVLFNPLKVFLPPWAVPRRHRRCSSSSTTCSRAAT